MYFSSWICQTYRKVFEECAALFLTFSFPLNVNVDVWDPSAYAIEFIIIILSHYVRKSKLCRNCCMMIVHSIFNSTESLLCIKLNVLPEALSKHISGVCFFTQQFYAFPNSFRMVFLSISCKFSVVHVFEFFVQSCYTNISLYENVGIRILNQLKLNI